MKGPRDWEALRPEEAQALHESGLVQAENEALRVLTTTWEAFVGGDVSTAREPARPGKHLGCPDADDPGGQGAAVQPP